MTFYRPKQLKLRNLLGPRKRLILGVPLPRVSVASMNSSEPHVAFSCSLGESFSKFYTNCIGCGLRQSMQLLFNYFILKFAEAKKSDS